jgi:acid phosphatase family membrane protein YuiD
VGQTIGWASPDFAIALIFAVIVMYDAAGVRQAAGKQARILNQIIDELFSEGKEFNEDRLKELLGHTPFQVIVGLMLGIAISCLASPASKSFRPMLFVSESAYRANVAPILLA